MFVSDDARRFRAFNAETGDIDIGSDKATKLLKNADHFAAHLEQVPVMVVACAPLESTHPTDTELGRLSVVGGASIYPAVQHVILGCREAQLGAALTTLLCLFEPQVTELKLSQPSSIEWVSTRLFSPKNGVLSPTPKPNKRRKYVALTAVSWLRWEVRGSRREDLRDILRILKWFDHRDMGRLLGYRQVAHQSSNPRVQRWKAGTHIRTEMSKQ